VAPVFLLLAIICATAAGLWAAALIIRFRDVRMIIPFVVQFGFFVSPIGYSSALVPPEWRLLYSLNPVAGIIDAFRWAILKEPVELFVPGLLVSAAVSLALLGFGLLYFRKVERNLADVI
jgi:lipopolysaccharide transport system permease protein